MAYGTVANGGFVFKPEVIKAVYLPGTPDATEPGFVDISQGILAEEPNVRGELVRQIPFEQEWSDAINRGLRRVITGPGTNTTTGYRSTTGEKLFFFYPNSAIPIAGKTGTAQGANNYPWNDSSAFAGYSLDPARPYTVTAYLEKAGYGSQAAAPVVKCMFMQLSGAAQADPVVLSDPLNTEAISPAPPREMSDPSCFAGRFSPVQIAE